MKQFKTVKELMDYLSTLPSDMPVVMGDYSYDIQEGYMPVEVHKVVTNEYYSIADHWEPEIIQKYGPVWPALKIGH
jgi:hypothetical protein